MNNGAYSDSTSIFVCESFLTIANLFQIEIVTGALMTVRRVLGILTKRAYGDAVCREINMTLPYACAWSLDTRRHNHYKIRRWSGFGVQVSDAYLNHLTKNGSRPRYVRSGGFTSGLLSVSREQTKAILHSRSFS